MTTGSLLLSLEKYRLAFVLIYMFHSINYFLVIFYYIYCFLNFINFQVELLNLDFPSLSSHTLLSALFYLLLALIDKELLYQLLILDKLI